jgi:hypothetical protein
VIATINAQSLTRLQQHVTASAMSASGTLAVDGQESQEVALKVVPFTGVSEARMSDARRELKMMCIVSQKLSGYVVELLGYCETEVELTLVMERAEMSLLQWCNKFDGARLPLHEWVRRWHVSEVCCCCHAGSFSSTI